MKVGTRGIWTRTSDCCGPQVQVKAEMAVGHRRSLGANSLEQAMSERMSFISLSGRCIISDLRVPKNAILHAEDA